MQVAKVDFNLAQHKMTSSGIDTAKEMFSDLAWLILAVATLSKVKDEIFGMNS